MSARALSASEMGLSLREASDLLGVSTTILRKLIRGGNIPEAEKVRTDAGRVWSIPRDALASIASREGWVIDLRAVQATAVAEASSQQKTEQAEDQRPEDVHDEDGQDPTTLDLTKTQDLVASAPQAIEVEPGILTGAPTLAEVLDLALLDRLLGAKEEAVTAQVHAERNLAELDSVLASRRDIAEELSSTRDELSSTNQSYRLEQAARAVAEAQVAELRERVAREAALAETERSANAEAAAQLAAREREATRATASLGWRGRRKFRRLQAQEDRPQPTEASIPEVPLALHSAARQSAATVEMEIEPTRIPGVTQDLIDAPDYQTSPNQPLPLFGRSSHSSIPEA